MNFVIGKSAFLSIPCLLLTNFLTLGTLFILTLHFTYDFDLPKELTFGQEIEFRIPNEERDPPPFNEDQPLSRTVCYFIPTKYGEEYDFARNIVMKTWAQYSAHNIFWVYSHFEKEEYFFNNNTIHLNTTEEYKTLPRKMFRMWSFLSETYHDVWKDRCGFFVKTDDDTYLNTRLVEKRLQCLDPGEEYYSGYNTQFGQGSFFFLSAALIPNLHKWLPSFKERHPWWWHGMPDHKFGMLLKENKIRVRSFTSRVQMVHDHGNFMEFLARKIPIERFQCILLFHKVMPDVHPIIHAQVLKLEAMYPELAPGKSFCFRNEGGYHKFDMKVINDVKWGCRVKEKMDNWQTEEELWGPGTIKEVNHWKKTGEDYYEILWNHTAVLRDKPFHTNPDPRDPE